mmetsp:Transcript_22452/g.55349  ORF Transcript_22452/g.55349 Transcript_22452/m.55349 type:complete len:241 (-) Transcript_22452:386-1108(-)
MLRTSRPTRHPSLLLTRRPSKAAAPSAHQPNNTKQKTNYPKGGGSSPGLRWRWVGTRIPRTSTLVSSASRQTQAHATYQRMLGMGSSRTRVFFSNATVSSAFCRFTSTGILNMYSCTAMPVTASIASRPLLTSFSSRALRSASDLVLPYTLRGSKPRKPGLFSGGCPRTPSSTMPIPSTAPKKAGCFSMPPAMGEGARPPSASRLGMPERSAILVCKSSLRGQPRAASIAKRPCLSSASL